MPVGLSIMRVSSGRSLARALFVLAVALGFIVALVESNRGAASCTPADWGCGGATLEDFQIGNAFVPDPRHAGEDPVPIPLGVLINDVYGSPHNSGSGLPGREHQRPANEPFLHQPVDIPVPERSPESRISPFQGSHNSEGDD